MTTGDIVTLVVALMSAGAAGYGVWASRGNRTADAAESNVATALRLRDEMDEALKQALERLRYLERADGQRTTELEQMRIVIRSQEVRLESQQVQLAELARRSEVLQEKLDIERKRVNRLRRQVIELGAEPDTGSFED